MNERGLVLMTVLWVVLVVAFISFALGAAVRAELASAGNSFDSARALFMARSAAEVMFLNVQKPGALGGAPIREEGRAEGRAYVIPFESGEARVQLMSESDRIDLNGADDKLLASMFDSLGLDQLTRNELVDCILDWRDPDDVPRLYGAEVDDYGQVFLNRGGRLPRNAPFTNMQEVMLVKYMTSEIYFGRVELDPSAQVYRKVPGLRDIATVGPGNAGVNVNAASIDVLAAVPSMNRPLAEAIVTERQQKSFSNMDDFAHRIPALQKTPTLAYLNTESGPPTLLVSTATIRPSGTTRIARLRFSRDLRKKIVSLIPFVYQNQEIVKFQGWEY